MRLCLPLLLCVGCTDIFALPIGGGGPDDQGADSDGGQDLPPVALDGDVDGGGGSDLPLVLPASCALLGCTPATNEGDVTLSNGSVAGCHAYGTLSISSTVQAGDSATHQAFQACADTIIITGALSANGRGEAAMSGTGAGKVCGTGGGHGGTGADPGMCGGGGTYGDPMLPRTLGSGGGGLSSSGGSGGGAIELAAGQIHLLGFITADGEAGGGASSGGGSGGSVLIHADSLDGAGQIQARGGLGIGLAGGGGGGGRVAVYLQVAAPGLKTDVKGGGTMNGAAGGMPGSVFTMP